MSIVHETFKEKLCSEGSTRKYNLDILKEIMHLSSSLSSEFFDMCKYGFCPATPFITPLMTTNFLISCCGPLMEMAFMCSALNFMNLLLVFLLINLLLIPYSCI